MLNHNLAQKPGALPGNILHIHNRKYLGSKQRLLPFIQKVILEQVPRIDLFIDGFAGTGVVACALAPYARQVIANDLLYSNYLVLSTYLATRQGDVSPERLQELCRELNTLPGQPGYVSEHFAGTYFTGENACKIGVVRERIEEWGVSGRCTAGEKKILLTSLLFAIDKIANTVGQYDAFLKNLGQESYSPTGRHLVDSRVYKSLFLELPAFDYYTGNRVYCRDLNDLLPELKGDVLYLDPPYNHRQYIDCYHLLENIMRWQKPAVFGKTKKFKRDHLKSSYSRRRQAPGAFRQLIGAARVGHIFLSYNNEGIIPDDIILQTLKSRGEVRIFESEYNVFGNGAGVSAKRPILERIFYCRVAKHVE